MHNKSSPAKASHFGPVRLRRLLNSTGVILYGCMNDQVVMMMTLLVLGATTVAIPFVPNVIYLYVCGSLSGAAMGVSHLGKLKFPIEGIVSAPRFLIRNQTMKDRRCVW